MLNTFVSEHTEETYFITTKIHEIWEKIQHNQKCSVYEKSTRKNNKKNNFLG